MHAGFTKLHYERILMSRTAFSKGTNFMKQSVV